MKSPTLSLVLVSAAIAAPAFAYVETTDLDWVTAPVVERVAQRLGPLAANRDRSGAQEREFRTLSKVYGRLRGPSERLADEFRELEDAASGLRGVADEAGSLAAAMTTALGRATEQLALRRGTVQDHVLLLPQGRARREIERRLAAAAKLESKAAAKSRPDRSAPLLRRAEKLLTAALVAADLEAGRLDLERPAPRVRNGALVGSAGGRIVLPDDGSPLAGLDLTLPPGAVDASIRLLVQEVPWTTNWPESTVATTFEVAVPPGDPGLLRPMSVSFRYDAAHAGDPTLAAGIRAPFSIPLEDAAFSSDGRVTAHLPAFGTVVALRTLPPPPHPEFPAETYHVVLAFGRATSGSSSTAESADGVVERDFTFGPGPTGSVSAGTLAAVERRFVGEAPRHADGTRTAALPGGAIEWSLRENGPRYSAGEYTISFPFDGDTLTGSGLLSRDGAVTVFSVRGATTSAIGFGLRDDATASAADLGKPWFVGTQGVRLEGAGSADFSEHRFVGTSRLVPDGADGFVADAGESRNLRTVRIRADVFPAEFSETSAWVAPEGIAGVSLGADGRLVADGGRTTGWVHSAAGLLVARTFDPSDPSAALVVGVRDDGGNYEDLFQYGGYGAWMFTASSRVLSAGTAAVRAGSNWGGTWTSLGVFWPAQRPDYVYYAAWAAGWMSLTVGEADAAPAWEASTQPGWGSSPPHPEEWFGIFGDPSSNSPRRGFDDEGGTSLVITPDGSAVLIQSFGRLGLAVLTRQ